MNVPLRQRQRDDKVSLYLDYYEDGKRKNEYLKMCLFPIPEKGNDYYIRFRQKKTKGSETLPISKQTFELIAERGKPQEAIINSDSFGLGTAAIIALHHFIFSSLNHMLCLLSAFVFISVHHDSAFIAMFLLPTALCFFPSLCSSSSLFLVAAMVVPLSLDNALTISSVCHFSPSPGFLYVPLRIFYY